MERGSHEKPTTVRFRELPDLHQRALRDQYRAMLRMQLDIHLRRRFPPQLMSTREGREELSHLGHTTLKRRDRRSFSAYERAIGDIRGRILDAVEAGVDAQLDDAWVVSGAPMVLPLSQHGLDVSWRSALATGVAELSEHKSGWSPFHQLELDLVGCRTCDASGYVPGSHVYEERCVACDGTGRVALHHEASESLGSQLRRFPPDAQEQARARVERDQKERRRLAEWRPEAVEQEWHPAHGENTYRFYIALSSFHGAFGEWPEGVRAAECWRAAIEDGGGGLRFESVATPPFVFFGGGRIYEFYPTANSIYEFGAHHGPFDQAVQRFPLHIRPQPLIAPPPLRGEERDRPGRK